MSTDTESRYGTLTRLFHWGMAALFLFQFLKFFDRINDGEHAVGEFIKPFHGTVGQVLLLLVVLRLLWALSRRVRPPAAQPWPALARVGHILLYVFMVLVPLTGISRAPGRGNGLQFLGVQIIERDGQAIPWLATVGSWHSTVVWVFAALAAGHVIMVLVHQFGHKDNLLRRMLG